MGIVFHDGSNEHLAGYTGGRAWNDANFLQHPPHSMNIANTPQLITAILMAIGSQSTLGRKFNGDFQGLIRSADINIWVVKGLHQQEGSLFGFGHITVSYDHYLWHIECLNDAHRGWVAINATKGQAVAKVDPDGWTIV